jgi:hypothetical protein
LPILAGTMTELLVENEILAGRDGARAADLLGCTAAKIPVSIL